MMAAIKEWIIGIVVTVLFMSIMDLVMPDNSFKKYAKLATGLIVVITILSPVFKMLNGGMNIEHYISAYAGALSSEGGVDTSQVQASVERQTIEAFKGNLKENIEESIKSDLDKTCQVTALDIEEDTSSKAFGKVSYMEIKTQDETVESVTPVGRVEIGPQAQQAAACEDESLRDGEVLKLLKERFSIDESAVKFVK